MPPPHPSESPSSTPTAQPPHPPEPLHAPPLDNTAAAAAAPQPATQMVSSVAGESPDNIETQEPVKHVGEAAGPPAAVEDSDVEDDPIDPADDPPAGKTGSVGEVVERIEEAGHLRDDEDADVDFGDEEEEDVQVAKPAPVADKPKKKGSPVKSIKKEAKKGRAKKPTSLVRKRIQSPKNNDEDDDASSKSSPRTSPKNSPKAKKTASKVGKGAKGMAKKEKGKTTLLAKGKTTKAAKDKEKGTKPKKTIAKEDKKGVKKPLVKKTDKRPAVVKTYSKKASASSAKTGKSKKAATDKKATKEEKKPTKRPKASKKAKAQASPSKSSEDEDEEMQVPDSDDEQNSASDTEEEMEDVPRTPLKQAILGHLACSSRDGNASALLEHAVQQLGKYDIISYGPESEGQLMAYIVGKETKRGWGVLQAIACGIPLVSEDWLSSSISEGKWKPINVFRSDQFGQSPRSVEGEATHSRMLEGQRIKVISDKKDAASIRKLVKLCGGRIAETRMDIVINDGGKVVESCANVEKKWLADSVEAGEILDFEGYIVEA